MTCGFERVWHAARVIHAAEPPAVKPLGMRKLAVIFALASAGAQLATGSATLASALTVGLHGIGHAHSVAVFAEHGHLHLVLSHGERSERAHGSALHLDDPRFEFTEGDHVIHLDKSDNATLRRATPDPAPALAVLVVSLPALAPGDHPVLPPEPRARGVDYLKTVVLRL